MKQYMDSIDSGSNYSFGDKMLKAENPRSAFDLSHLNTLTIPNGGALIPIWLQETVPSDSFDISVKSLLRVMPQVVPLYSRQRLYIYGFWSRSCDLWKGAHAYYKKGFDGNLVLNKPKLTSSNVHSDAWDVTITPDSLADYLGLPQGHNLKALATEFDINALPFLMYEKIFQAYFIEKNLPFYRDNRAWLPHDEADLRFGLSDNAVISNSYLESGQTGVSFGKIHFRNYPLDYFTSALPSPTRGNAPTLDFNVSEASLTTSLDKSKILAGSAGSPSLLRIKSDGTIYVETFNTSSSPTNVSWVATGTGTPPSGTTFEGKFPSSAAVSTRSFDFDSTTGQKLIGKLNSAFSTEFTGILKSDITLDKLRGLSILTEEVERMARTDGTYIDFGLTFYGKVCRNALDYRPTLIGASYQSINFSEVLQTSPTSGSPLGAYGGHGISLPSSDGYIGHLDCDDYGYIMLIACIMPDVYYHQGLSSLWTNKLQSEEFLPKRAKMGLVPVYNRELFVTGTASTDNDLFAYQNPFDRMRYCENEIHGKIADSTSESFYPYTQARTFVSTPTYSNEFFVADDVRKEYLAAPIEDAYSAQFQIDCRAVRPLSYIPVPATLV